MKHILFALSVLFCTIINAQIEDPVSWSFSVEQNGEEATLISTATIEEGWHVYAQVLESDQGPVATEFTFKPNVGYALNGKNEESETHQEYDKNFEMNLSFFEDKAVFKQKINVTSATDFKIDGNVYFMVCNDEKCLPPTEEEFSFDIKGVSGESTESVLQEGLPAEEMLEGNVGDQDSESTGIFDPVKWTFTTNKISDTEYDVVATAAIEEHWHVYATKLESDDGPNKTEFIVNENEAFELVGELKEEGSIISKYDKGFDMETQYYANSMIVKQRIKLKDPSSNPIAIGEVYFQTCDEEKCLPPTAIPYKINVKTGGTVEDEIENSSSNSSEECEPKKFEGNESTQEKEGLGGMFILAFLFGLTTLLTPCVFPMIPMTVSFFIKDKGKGIRNALIYGLSIILIYTLIGTLVSVFFGASFSNWLATHWFPNTLFFVVFVVFAASFFGMFEITMPSWIVSKADKGADRGGLIGVFFMALTLVVVSFSCTGPIVGIILIDASQGAVLEPMIGMLGFSLAFALPFTLFAVFPSLLNKLPQSGGWLNSVKVVLGFLELALALKFLSIADLTYHWGLLDRHIFIALWIVIFGLLGVYLLGKIKFSHDSDLPFLKVPRLLFAILVFSFTIYLIPGLFGSPLKLLAGYLPPMSTHEFNLIGAIEEEEGLACETNTLYSDFLHLPHKIKGYYTYEEAIACAKSQEKPLFIDFTGHGCPNCRKMEASVWTDSRVMRLLKEEFVVVALYCDDKTELPEDEWYESKFDGRLKKTIGDKNLDFQICAFNNNAQPLYVLLDNNEELCAPTIGAEWDANVFYEHLKKGLDVFNARKLKE